MQPGAIMAGGVGTIAPTTRAGSLERGTWLLAGAASTLGLFLLSHPYWGIVHDAELYVGRAMADMDPAGLGRDMLFANDGQSAFSLYPRLSGSWLRLAGPDLGALSLTLASLAAWLAAAASFAARLAGGRLLWACIVVAAVVPSHYGQVFRYSEQFATPRLPAEALVLAGLAALASGRHWMALAALALGAAIHPIMAASGLAVWVLFLVGRDRRWLLLPVSMVTLVATAAAAGLPVAERLFRLMDPTWAEALSVNAYLFPSHWPESAWSTAAIRAATVLLALPFIPGAGARRVLGAILLVACLGVALTYVAADRWLVLLIVQAQPWRALWLLGVAGALALPIAAIGLWRSGPAGRVALGCLALGWLAAPLSLAGAAAGGVAVLAAALGRRRPDLFTPRIANGAALVAAVVAALILALRASVLIHVLSAKPEGASFLGFLWLFWILSIPVALAAILLAAQPRRILSARAAAGLALALLGTAVFVWDDRPALTRVMDRHAPDPELARLLPAGPGEVLWLKNGAGFAWRLAARANWAGYLQGAAIVFSPDLGRIWLNRMDRLAAAGLADDVDRSPWRGHRSASLQPSLSDFRSICSAPDGPVAIVIPLNGSIILPAGLVYATYRMPAPQYDLGERQGRLSWITTDAQAVVNCSPDRQSGALRGTLPG